MTATQVINIYSTSIGAILVGPLTGARIDRGSRMFGKHITAIINRVVVVIAGAAQHLGMLIATHLTMGMGFGFGQNAATTYIEQLNASKIPSFALALCFSGWAAAILLAAGISDGVSKQQPENSLSDSAAPKLKLGCN